MTTKEAIWLVKQTAQDKKHKLILKYDGCEIPCTNITDEDFHKNCKFESEHNFKNPWKGIYVDVNKAGEVIYGICVGDEKANCIYSCNIKDLELVRNE